MFGGGGNYWLIGLFGDGVVKYGSVGFTFMLVFGFGRKFLEWRKQRRARTPDAPTIDDLSIQRLLVQGKRNSAVRLAQELIEDITMQEARAQVDQTNTLVQRYLRNHIDELIARRAVETPAKLLVERFEFEEDEARQVVLARRDAQKSP